MPGGRVRRLVVLVACVLLAALALPAVAPAKRGLLTGFVDADGLLSSADPAERATWLDRTVEARAGIVRLDIKWALVVGPQRPPDPTNPGSSSYDFTSIDVAVRAAEARGLAVMLQVQPGAPAWAEAPGRRPDAPAGTWKPNPSNFADFAQAVAARYSGHFDPDGPSPVARLPAVQALQVWNEPNLSGHLTPQYEGMTAISPEQYRQMLNAAYSAVKAVAPQMPVVTAGAGPYGDPPGASRVRPVLFWQQVLCVHPVKVKAKKKKRGAPRVKYVRTAGCPAPAKFDIFGFHAINTSGGPGRSAINRNDASSADLDRIVRVLHGAEHAGTVLPRRHPIWTTEMWFDTPSATTVPLGRWIEQGFYLLWKEGASVVMNLAIRDSTIEPGDLLPQVGPNSSGIFFANGQPKPAYTAFRFPFVTERIDKRVLRAWGKAPAGGKLVIQRRQPGRWVATKKIQLRQGSVFTAKLRLRGKQRLRAKVAGSQSLVWKQS
jgi:hypothetical protein